MGAEPDAEPEAEFTPIWWPAATRFEVCAGAILTQNTAWTSVERALDNLRAAQLLHAAAITCAPEDVLRELITPAGFYRQKARYLRAIAQWFLQWDDVVRTQRPALSQVRESLLATVGVGPETADDILLYAYHYPVFIIDTYARRALAGAGYHLPAGYQAALRALEVELAAADFSAGELAIFHALIVQAGKMVGPGGDWGPLVGR